MNPFLLGMRSDLFAKAPYLKYLRVSSKFIRPCACKSPVHTYCITAQVIRNQCVTCAKCGSQFKLYVKEQQLCSKKLISLAGTYFMTILLIMSGFAGLVVADAYAKHVYFLNNPDEAIDVSGRNVFIGIDIIPDYKN